MSYPYLGKIKDTSILTQHKQLFNKYINKSTSNTGATATTIVDVFGGSGQLSKVFAEMFPDNQVMYNDFDYYTELFDNPKLMTKLNKFFEHFKSNHSKYDWFDEISDSDRTQMISYIKQYFSTEERKHIALNFLLSNYLTYNGKPFDYDNPPLFYHRLRKHPLKVLKLDEYLPSNITVIHKDFRDIKLNPSKDFIIINPFLNIFIDEILPIIKNFHGLYVDDNEHNIRLIKYTLESNNKPYHQISNNLIVF